MKLTSFRAKLSFIVLLITAGMDWLSFGLVFPIFSAFVYRPELQFLPAHVPSLERGIWLGALLAVGPGISFFSSTIFGTFSDQKGRKKALQWTLCIVTLGFATSTLGVLLKNLVVVFIGRMVMGIGGGNTAIVNAAIADTSTRQEKASRYGLVSMANGIGFTIGPALGGMLSHWGGYAMPFALAGLVTVINLILLSFFLKESFQNKMRQHLHMRQEFKLLREAMRVSGIPILFCCFFIYSIGWSFYWEFIPVTWIEGYHLSTEEIGLLYAYGSLFYVVSSGLLIRPIIKKVAPLLILFAAWIFLGGTLIPLFHTNIKGFWTFIPIQQFLMALLLPTGVALISNLASAEDQGKIMGAFQSMQTLAFVTSPLLGGVIVSVSYNMPIHVGMIAVFLAGIILLAHYRSRIFRT